MFLLDADQLEEPIAAYPLVTERIGRPLRPRLRLRFAQPGTDKQREKDERNETDRRCFHAG